MSCKLREISSFHDADVAQLVAALCYKPEGRGLDSRGVIGIFH
jgi:hypothetical protein